MGKPRSIISKSIAVLSLPPERDTAWKICLLNENTSSLVLLQAAIFPARYGSYLAA